MPCSSKKPLGQSDEQGAHGMPSRALGTVGFWVGSSSQKNYQMVRKVILSVEKGPPEHCRVEMYG